MTKEIKYYCDFCRDITHHIVKGMNIVCINYKEHKKIEWCSICGGRKDLDNDDPNRCRHLKEYE